MQFPATTKAPAVPRTSAELGALRAQRDELREQLREINEYRGRLVQERFNAQATNNTAVMEELQGRIKELGQRSIDMERSMLQADDAIASAVANGVAAPSEAVVAVARPDVRTITIPPVAFGAARAAERTLALMAGEALLFVLLGIVAWRWAWRRGARSAAVTGGGSRDVAQLQQSIDAIAIEVERISENQRFVTRLLNENAPVDRSAVPSRANQGSRS